MAKIDAKNKTINSGFCSGNKQVNIKQVLNDASQVRKKGTVRSYCYQSGGKSVEIKKEHNSGAFSGEDGQGGSVDKGNQPPGAIIQKHPAYEDSKVIGTLQSFNVGIPWGYSEPPDHWTFEEISWNKEPKICNEDQLFGCGSYGTLGSFNAIGQDSEICADRATINSGCAAGNRTKDNRYLTKKIDQKIKEDPFGCYQCWGTVKSFNAASGEQIIVERATLNTGAFAGIATEQGQGGC